MIVIRRVVGKSMLPSLHEGRLVIGMRPLWRVPSGSVVIFRHKGKEKIKRLADSKDNQIFLLGDNPPHSTDSRDFGWIERRDVIARIVWPRSRTHRP